MGTLRIKDLWRDFQNFIAAQWEKGWDETKIESCRRKMREADVVSKLLDSPGWEILRTRFAGELLNELNLLSIQMRSGNLSDSALKMKTAKICAKTDFMEVIRAVLLEGDAAREELKKEAAERTEQAEMPSVESLAAEG